MSEIFLLDDPPEQILGAAEFTCAASALELSDDGFSNRYRRTASRRWHQRRVDFPLPQRAREFTLISFVRFGISPVALFVIHAAARPFHEGPVEQRPVRQSVCFRR